MTTTSVGLRIYDPFDLEAPPQGFDDYHDFAEISPDAKMAISRAADGQTVVWDTATGDLVFALAEEAPISNPKFSPDGGQIVAIVEGSIRIWDATDGSTLETIDIDAIRQYVGLFFRDDGDLLAVGHDDTTTFLWNVTDDEMILEFGDFALVPFSFVITSANGHVVAIPVPAAGQDANIISYSNIGVWDTTTGEYIRRVRTTSQPGLSPDGSAYVAYDFQGMIVRDLESDRDIQTLAVPTADAGNFFGLTELAMSPDGSMVGGMDFNGRLVISFLDSGDAVELSDFGTSIASLDVSPDGRTVLLGSYLGKVTLADMATGEIIRIGDLGNASSAFFLSDGDQILTVGTDVSIWDAIDFQRDSFVLSSNSSTSQISPDGTLVAIVEYESTLSGSSGPPPQSLRVWNIESDNEELPSVSLGQSNELRYLRFSPDSRYLAVSSGGETILFDLQSAEPVNSTSFEGAVQLVAAFHPDSESLTIAATYIDSTAVDFVSTVELWSWRVDADQPELLAAIESAVVTDVAHSPDGRLLALGGTFEGGSILLWDVESQEIITILGHNQLSALQIRFTPNGDAIVVVGADNLLHIFGLPD